MARKPNDGKGRMGGRAKGTPNKDKPLKALLRDHSINYFTPSIEELDDYGLPTGNLLSQFEIDIRSAKPAERAKLQRDMMKYHTPQMQATNVDMSVQQTSQQLTDRLSALARGEDIKSPD